MKVLITGICGFAGSALAAELALRLEGLEVFGLDNLSRPGSETNRRVVQGRGIKFFHGDIRNPSDLEDLPQVDWVIDASANPSVLAGVTGQTSSRQLMEHNLVGTLHLLEWCKRQAAGFVLLSTSRVYSLDRLCGLPMDRGGRRLAPRLGESQEPGFSAAGVSEAFSTAPPLSLYGAAKRASEVVTLEYARAFPFPVYVNRCGVLAGAGQFGKPDQGIVAFWLHSWKQSRPLKYIGFGGEGAQVRDALHPRDLAALIARQMGRGDGWREPLNVAGGVGNSFSLAELSHWCGDRFGKRQVGAAPEPRPYDVPWLVLDATVAKREWAWEVTVALPEILEEIARQAEAAPGWLDISTGT